MFENREYFKILTRCVKGYTHADYARVTELAETYETLITGHNIESLLIHFNPREDKEMFEQRVRLTQSVTPAVSEKIMSPFEKVSRIDSITKVVKHEAEVLDTRLTNHVENFYGEESVSFFLDSRFKELTFCDPNAWIVIEKDKNGYYPLEVSSHEAVDYLVKNNRLEYLLVKKPSRYIDSKGESKEGFSYVLYFNDLQFKLSQVAKGDSDIKPFNESSQSGDIVKIGHYHYLFEVFEPRLKRIQAIRVGYKRDLLTKGRTYVNPFHAALPRFMKTIKSVSELDLTTTLHTFPQKIQYVQLCQGHNGSICDRGKGHNGQHCKSCNGSGIVSHQSSQSTIDIPMPRDSEDMIDLNKLLVYKNPEISLLEFQDKYASKLEDESLRDVFSTDVFIKSGIQDTATGKVIDMQSVYDTIHPYSQKYSSAFIYIVKTISDFEAIENPIILHKFPRDFKMKTISSLLADLKEANESYASILLKTKIDDDIAEKIYIDNPRELKKHRVKSEHTPFLGKSLAEIQYIISAGLSTKESNVLWSEFTRIFSELEVESFKTGKDFYDLSFDRRNDLIHKKVEQLIKELGNEGMIDNTLSLIN